MAGNSFSEIGKIEALRRLYEQSPFKAEGGATFEASGKGAQVVSASRIMLEGIDFDLVYFPLRHLGYKAVLAVCGELYAKMAHPRRISRRCRKSGKELSLLQRSTASRLLTWI